MTTVTCIFGDVQKQETILVAGSGDSGPIAFGDALRRISDADRAKELRMFALITGQHTTDTAIQFLDVALKCLRNAPDPYRVFADNIAAHVTEKFGEQLTPADRAFITLAMLNGALALGYVLDATDEELAPLNAAIEDWRKRLESME